MSSKKDCPEHKHVLESICKSETDRLRLWDKNELQDIEISKKVSGRVAMWSYGLILGLILMLTQFNYTETKDMRKDFDGKMSKLIKGVQTGDWSDLAEIMIEQNSKKIIDSLYREEKKIDLGCNIKCFNVLNDR